MFLSVTDKDSESFTDYWREPWIYWTVVMVGIGLCQKGTEMADYELSSQKGRQSNADNQSDILLWFYKVMVEYHLSSGKPPLNLHDSLFLTMAHSEKVVVERRQGEDRDFNMFLLWTSIRLCLHSSQCLFSPFFSSADPFCPHLNPLTNMTWSWPKFRSSLLIIHTTSYSPHVIARSSL